MERTIPTCSRLLTSKEDSRVQGLALCANMDLDLEELSDQWELHALNKGLVGNHVDEDMLQSFSKTLKRRKRKSNVMSFASLEDKLMDIREVNTPVKKGADRAEEPVTPAPSGNPIASPTNRSPTLHSVEASAFKKRTQSGIVVSSFVGSGAKKFEDGSSHTNRRETRIEEIQPQLKVDESSALFRDRLEDKAAYLESRINDFTERILASRKLANGSQEVHPVSRASQEQVLCVGRICCDSEGKLNEQSMMLEGSMKHSNGQRVKLELGKLENYSVFPGQCVAVEGYNLSGHCLVAEKLFTGIPPARPTTSAQEIQSTANPDQPLRIMVACGPFTTTEDLSYDPLEAFLSKAEEMKPDVLLLVGPYVDAADAQIASGNIGVTFDKLFADKCQDMIIRYCNKAGKQSKVVLVPSIRDVTHYPVFPQPPMGKLSHYEDQVYCLPNPCTFKIPGEGVVIGCCSQDILKHLAAAELSRVTGSGVQSDRMSRLAAGVVGQASYYPMYPTVRGCFFDASLGGALVMPELPDILILPSDLAPFAKSVVPSCDAERLEKQEVQQVCEQQKFLCINPSRLAKGMSGGTYATIHVESLGLEAEGASGNARINHQIEARSKVDIVRI